MKWFAESDQPRHLISADQFDREDLERLFAEAHTLKGLLSWARRGDNDALRKWMELSARGKKFHLYLTFYEPSTRTRFSMDTAAKQLGMQVSQSENARQFSSGAKGESISRTMENLRGFTPFPIAVVRYDEVGGAQQAIKGAGMMPVINAGDGRGEHPTQALLDCFTIREELGSIDGNTIVFGGDLKYGRTVHSLITMLCLYDEMNFVLCCPEELDLPDEYFDVIEQSRNKVRVIRNPRRALAMADVVYWTRMQKERLPSDFGPKRYKRLRREYRIDNSMMDVLPPTAILLHPQPIDSSQPKLAEIADEVDRHPQARYMQQSWNGVPVRMAIFLAVIEQQESLRKNGQLAD